MAGGNPRSFGSLPSAAYVSSPDGGETFTLNGEPITLGGGGVPTCTVRFQAYCNSAPTNGVDLQAVLQQTAEADGVRQKFTVTSLPQTVVAGVGSGFGFYLEVPASIVGTLVVDTVEITVSNGDGTEKIVLFAGLGIPAVTGGFDMTAWSIAEQIGTDLARSGDGSGVDSTAGGQYAVSLRMGFIYNDAA